jgi:hypothetical protein
LGEIAQTLVLKDKPTAVDSFMIKTLLNCYSSISFIKSAEILSKKLEEVNPFTKENIALLRLDNYIERYRDDVKRLDKDTKNLRELFEISKEQVDIFLFRLIV